MVMDSVVRIILSVQSYDCTGPIIIIIIIGVFWAQDAVILCAQIIALEVEFLFEVIFCWLITPELV